MKYITSKNNFYVFTLALILMMLASSFVDSFGQNIAGHRLLHALIFLVQMVAYFSLNLSKHWRNFVLAILGLALVINVLREVSDWQVIPVLNLLLTLAFFCGMAAAASKQVLFSGEVTWNSIVGTVAVYLLLGLIWSLIYLITMEYWPNAFNGIEYRNWNDNMGLLNYFSFVTMTPLRYGDISPAVPITRTLVFLQSVCGTFYMAIVVASIIGSRHSVSDNS